jgi:hypothetical protein
MNLLTKQAIAEYKLVKDEQPIVITGPNGRVEEVVFSIMRDIWNDPTEDPDGDEPRARIKRPHAFDTYEAVGSTSCEIEFWGDGQAGHHGNSVFVFKSARFYLVIDLVNEIYY